MKIYGEQDASLTPLDGDDAYLETARADGFATFPIAEATRRGDVLLLLTTDESQPEVWAEHVASGEVRTLFERGSGVLAAVAVHQDASGHAWGRMMAIAKGIGATRGGVYESPLREEAELDLFAEQVVWPGLSAWLEQCFEIGVEAADRLVVLRHGQKVADIPSKGVTVEELVALIVGFDAAEGEDGADTALEPAG